MNQRLLWASVSTGVAVALPLLVRGNVMAAALGAVAAALLFGGLLGWVESRSRARLLLSGTVPSEIPVRPCLTLLVTGSCQEVVEGTIKAMSEFAVVRDVRSLGTGGVEISAEVPRSFRHGLGEFVTIRIASYLSGSTRVVIASRPRHDSTTIDLGRNYAHVQRIHNALVDKFGSSAVAYEGVVDAAQIPRASFR